MTSLESQLEESLRQVHSRRDLLAFLIGAPELESGIVEVPVPAEDRSLETYLAQAPNRPDIQAAQASVKSVKNLLHVARADYLPSLNATANSYTDRKDAGDPDWDVLLSVDVPIWNWGGRQGAVGAADAVLKQEEQEMQLALRQAELEIRDAHRNYLTAKRQMELQQRTVDLARRDYEMQVRDDAQGLVTNLEVFASLDRLNNAELALNNARLEEKLAAINLQIAAGARPDEILK
jgi:multidrug efflux system outer membrane protein